MPNFTEISVIDQPNETDYNGETFLDMCSGRGDYQRPYEEIILFNQGQSGACTRFGLIHGNNGQNILEYKKSGFKYEQINPIDVWNRGDKDKRLTSALSQVKKEGLIEGYVLLSRNMELLKKIEAFKKSIDNGYYIYTGIENIDRVKTNKNPLLVMGGKGIGHAMTIIDYNDDTKQFKFVNSFGKERGDKGYLYIRYEDINKLMSAYAIIDKDNSGIFQAFKRQEQARNSIKQLQDMYKNLDDALIRVQIHTLADTIRKEYKIS